MSTERVRICWLSVSLTAAIAILFGGSIATAQRSVAVSSGPAGAALDRRLRSMADSGLSGAVVVARHDTVLLEAGYGLANRERKTQFTPTTIAQVGSLTKQFTATAIADLVRRGRLHVEDSIAAILHGVPASARGITIQMLLTHTAGLPDDCGDDFARVSKNDLIERCLAHPLEHPPGSVYGYSNLGYSVLGAILEEVSGEPLEQYLDERFFRPLGLVAIGYAFPRVPPESLAIGYGKNGAEVNIFARIAALNGEFWDLKGNGGMQASADAMYRWHLALEHSAIIPREIRDMLYAPRVEIKPGAWYGYGWAIRTDSLRRIAQVSHSGSDGVFVSLWYWRPLEGVFIYSVTNSGESDLATHVVAELVKVLKNQDKP